MMRLVSLDCKGCLARVETLAVNRKRRFQIGMLRVKNRFGLTYRHPYSTRSCGKTVE